MRTFFCPSRTRRSRSNVCAGRQRPTPRVGASVTHFASSTRTPHFLPLIHSLVPYDGDNGARGQRSRRPLPPLPGPAPRFSAPCATLGFISRAGSNTTTWRANTRPSNPSAVPTLPPCASTVALAAPCAALMRLVLIHRIMSFNRRWNDETLKSRPSR